MVKIKELTVEDVELIRSIDRSETITGVYTYNDGAIHLTDVVEENNGFPEEEIQKIIKKLNHLFNTDGKFYGAFYDDVFVGLTALGVEPVGKLKDKLPLELLYTSKSSRGLGVGSKLIQKVVDDVQDLGYKKLYISATPTINTVDFYLSKGAVITKDPDPQILAEEADDIHLELLINEN